jgi:hypothetical protein
LFVPLKRKQRILMGYSAKRHLTHLDQAMIAVFIVNRVIARAQYSVELAHEQHMAIDWKSMQRTYGLVEYLLNQLDT